MFYSFFLVRIYWRLSRPGNKKTAATVFGNVRLL